MNPLAAPTCACGTPECTADAVTLCGQQRVTGSWCGRPVCRQHARVLGRLLEEHTATDYGAVPVGRYRFVHDGVACTRCADARTQQAA